MESSETIGQRIKAVRGGLSQKVFGQRIGLSQTAVTALENDQSEPRLGTFNSIIEAFNVNPEWLRTGEGVKVRNLGTALADAFRPLVPTVAHSRTHGEARTAVQAPEPASLLTVAYPTPEEYRQLQRENQELREQLARKEGALVAVEEDRTWLRKQIGGKTEASADAATENEPAPMMELTRNHEYVEMPEVAPRRAVGFKFGL